MDGLKDGMVEKSYLIHLNGQNNVVYALIANTPCITWTRHAKTC